MTRNNLAWAFFFVFAIGILVIGFMFAKAAQDSALAQREQADATRKLTAAMEENAKANHALRQDWVRAVDGNTATNMPTMLQSPVVWGSPSITSSLTLQAVATLDTEDVRQLVTKYRASRDFLSREE